MKSLNRIIEDKLNELNKLCARHRVRRLELFGSATTIERFEPETSDLDFLVEFQDMSPGEHAEAYFGLLEDLQDLFQKPVDLVEVKAVTNPYFLDSINRTRKVIYAA